MKKLQSWLELQDQIQNNKNLTVKQLIELIESQTSFFDKFTLKEDEAFSKIKLGYSEEYLEKSKTFVTNALKSIATQKNQKQVKYIK